MPSRRTRRVTAGAALVKSIVGGLPAGVELDERERAVLDLASAQADDIARLEADVKEHGTRIEGSTGRPVLNPALIELRQSRLALGRLLAQLDLPDGGANVAQLRRAHR